MPRLLRALVPEVFGVRADVAPAERADLLSVREPERAVVERLLRKPPPLARAELGQILKSADVHDRGSTAHAAALDFNARLLTAIRETCQARGVNPPWLGGK